MTQDTIIALGALAWSLLLIGCLLLSMGRNHKDFDGGQE